MNIEHLKLFVRIAVTQNISLAGKEFGLSPAVSSAHINKLEEKLGVKLIHRTTRKVALTEEGQEFLPHAKQVLEAIDVACASVGSGNIDPRGTLRITAPSSFGHMHIVPALKNFLGLYPKLKVDLHFSDSVIDIIEGGFDVAIRNSAMQDSSMIARKLAKDNRIVCASPDYITVYGEPETPEELKDHSCIQLMNIDTWLFDDKKTPKRIKINSKLSIDNGESVKNACADGIGISVCSKWVAYKELNEGRLVQILKDYPLKNETDIWAVYPGTRLLAPKVRVFINYLLGYFGDKPYWET